MPQHVIRRLPDGDYWNGSGWVENPKGAVAFPTIMAALGVFVGPVISEVVPLAEHYFDQERLAWQCRVCDRSVDDCECACICGTTDPRSSNRFDVGGEG